MKFVVGLLCSLFVGGLGGMPLKAAERLEVQLDGMLIPISIRELVDWESSSERTNSELNVWLNLLDRESRVGLLKLLQAPLLNKRSMARQLLRSWAGRQLLEDVSNLIRIDGDSSGTKVFNTLEKLLENQYEVSTIDLLQALPAEKIRVDLDALLQVATRLRNQLQNQQKLLLSLEEFSLDYRPLNSISSSYNSNQKVFPEPFVMKVAHRSVPLTLEIWRPQKTNISQNSWVVLMPGLGGSPNHFHWLSRRLSQNGWPVVVLDHPGSDLRAVRALLEGRSPLPGAEMFSERLADLNSVFLAKKNGELEIGGDKLILVGHSLGALTALLASGARPEVGLKNRCYKELSDLSLINPSLLLQCQLVDVPLEKGEISNSIKSIIALNSFGSLLWPSYGSAALSASVLLIGGTLDLITPPLSEQLSLLMSIKPNVFSRVFLVEGASHFSPIRIEPNIGNKRTDDLFKLGEEFVGVKPFEVQNLLAEQIIFFLENINNGQESMQSGYREMAGVRAYVLDRFNVERLLTQ